MQGTLQVKLQAHRLTEEQEVEIVEGFECVVPCSTPSLTDLKQKVLQVMRDINGEIRTQGRDRDRRFFVIGLYNGPGVRDEAVGNICIENDIAVYFDLDGNQGSTAFRSRKQRTVQKVHISEETGKVVCKWYEPVLNEQEQHVRYNSKLAYNLSVKEVEGFNITAGCESILSAVKMIPDAMHNCCWLCEDDRFVG